MPEADVIPERRAPDASTVHNSAAAAARKAVDILVVDDNRSKLLALEAALAPLGENVVAAQSGIEALRHLLDRDFATVILDVNMPGLDGFETARMIRSRPRSETTPIIFVSAVNIDEADAYRGYSLGAVDYIFAPIVPEVLRAKVSVFVDLQRKSEEARIHAQRLEERTRELEKSQRELRLSERMASIGTLCAGLGHDMGNLLLPVTVWIDSIGPMDLPKDLHEGVQNLSACVQYLRRLAGGLRLVSLDPTRDLGESHVVLRGWRDEVAPILRNGLPRGVSLEIDMPDDLPAVRIAPHRLAQAVFNLVQNAGDVLRDQPDAVVRLWAVHEAQNQGVRIGVSDDGPGMSHEVRSRCLDPFFTTKSRGISTGLGLSLVHGITQAAGASLEIETAPGAGTTFSFVLSCTDDPPSVPVAAIVTVSDPRVRALATALVRAAGCDVVEQLSNDPHRPAVWVTEPGSNLEQRAAEFTEGRRDRRVYMLTEEGNDSGEIRAASLTGPRGLAKELRQFLKETSKDRDASAPLAEAVRLCEDGVTSVGTG